MIAKISKLFDREWYFRKYSKVYKCFASKEQYDFLMLKHQIRLCYEFTFHTPLHLCRPQTLNEKLIWLSLYWKHPLVVQYADKYRMREYVTKTCGLPEDLLVPLLGVYKSTSEIDFDQLPNEFVLKCNHGSGYNLFIRDKQKMDRQAVCAQLDVWMSQPYRGAIAELHYLDIAPRLIICEPFLSELSDEHLLMDYKYECINGVPQFIHVCYDRDDEGHAEYRGFTLDWKQFDGKPVDLPKPQSLDLMYEYAKVLSKAFPHVRVDFYEVNGKPMLSELTFTPYGNMITYFSDETLLKYGQMMKLPKKYKK